MIKTLVKQMSKKDRKFSIITPFLIIGEVTMETTIPMLMATLVDVGIQNSDIGYVVKMGLLMVLMAMLSLAFGAGAARTASCRFSRICGEYKKSIIL